MNKPLTSEKTTKQAKLDELVTPTVQSTDINVEEILKGEGFSNVMLLGKGWSSEAYSAGFDGKDCIVRIPKLGGGGFDTYRKEHAILDIIADKIKSVKIPRTHIYEREGLAYVVHEKIHGNCFEINSFERLKDEEQNNFSQSVANFFSELHVIDTSEFSNIDGIHWGKIDTESLKADFEKYLEFLKKEGWEEYLIFNRYEIAAFCNFVESVTSLKEPEVLLHRDFYEKNFVVDDNMRLIGVFDFGNSSLANRAIEFNHFIKRNNDGTFQEPLVLKKILSYYQQATGAHVTFNDIANQLRLADAYCFSWLVSTDDVLNNNKENLRACATRIKKWLQHYMVGSL